MASMTSPARTLEALVLGPAYHVDVLARHKVRRRDVRAHGQHGVLADGELVHDGLERHALRRASPRWPPATQAQRLRKRGSRRCVPVCPHARLLHLRLACLRKKPTWPGCRLRCTLCPAPSCSAQEPCSSGQRRPTTCSGWMRDGARWARQVPGEQHAPQGEISAVMAQACLAVVDPEHRERHAHAVLVPLLRHAGLEGDAAHAPRCRDQGPGLRRRHLWRRRLDARHLELALHGLAQLVGELEAAPEHLEAPHQGGLLLVLLVRMLPPPPPPRLPPCVVPWAMHGAVGRGGRGGGQVRGDPVRLLLLCTGFLGPRHGASGTGACVSTLLMLACC